MLHESIHDVYTYIVYHLYIYNTDLFMNDVSYQRWTSYYRYNVEKNDMSAYHQEQKQVSIDNDKKADCVNLECQGTRD